jgi:hypothetical protein
MKDDRYPRTRYSDVLGEDPSPERVRLVEDIQALYSPQQPPQSVASSVRMAIREEAEKLRTQETAHPARVWPRPLRRGLGVAGFAGFALVVAAVALGLSAMLARMGSAPDPDGSSKSGDGYTGASIGPVNTRPEGTLSPLLSGSGVLHIKRTITARTVQGEVDFEMESELWYDRATGEARYQERDPWGHIDRIMLHEGQTDSLYLARAGQVNTETIGVGAVPLSVRAMFASQEQLERGELRQVGGVVVPSGQIAAVRKNAGARPVISFVDTATGLTRKLQRMHWSGHDGDWVYEYPVIETVDRSSLPEDFFSISSVRSLPTVTPPTREPTLAPPQASPTAVVTP